MNALNQCNFIGNLGADPEIRYTANQDAVIAKSEMMGTLLFKRLTTHFVVTGSARA